MPKMTTYTRLQAGNAIRRIQHTGGMGIARVALAFLALGGIFSVIEGATAKTAKAAATGSVAHHIINGPWYLHPGNPTDTPSISSPVSDLMPTGTEFDVQCVMTGSAITPDGNLATGGNGDTAWEYGTDAATGNIGFVSDQGLDTQVTQGQEIAQLNAQGIPQCGSQSSNSTQQTTQSSNSGVTTVFFSPNEIPSGQQGVDFNDPTLAEVPFSKWAPGNCSDAAVRQYVPPTVNTLAGWSLSRLAPIYFLAANPDRWGQIHTIILFDPGSTKEITQLSLWDQLRGMQPPCDLQYDINSLLANWLQSNASNQLLVFTGLDSEQDRFQGLWTHYFAGTWNQPFANQAIVCDYNNMQHPDVLQNFAGYVADLALEPMTNCPPSPDNTQWPQTQWNP